MKDKTKLRITQVVLWVTGIYMLLFIVLYLLKPWLVNLGAFAAPMTAHFLLIPFAAAIMIVGAILPFVVGAAVLAALEWILTKVLRYELVYKS